VFLFTKFYEKTNNYKLINIFFRIKIFLFFLEIFQLSNKRYDIDALNNIVANVKLELIVDAF